jgi:resuscitation-promoting factor RpfA
MKRIWLGIAIAVDAVAVAALVPGRALPHHLADPRGWIDAVGADAVTARLAAAVLWLVALWLAVGLFAAACTRVPGALGRVAHTVARLVLPRVIYRLAAGAAGMGMLLSPAVAEAGTPAAAQHVVATPAPAWPSDDTLAPPVWPTTRRPATAASHRPAPDTTPARAVSTVLVAPGDSLWRIAASRLPRHASARRIAAEWPRWYAVNRREIGGDPNHIKPGEVLATPHTPAQEEPS